MRLGDFMQLPAVKLTSIYNTTRPEGTEGRRVWESLNTYVELEQNFRLPFFVVFML